MNSKTKIQSLQALRAICFIGVYLNHIGVPRLWGPLGVCTFFVLSGFLLMLRSDEQEFSLSPLDSIIYSLKKIGKLYPLYLLSLFLCLFLDVYTKRENFVEFVTNYDFKRNLILNLTLMQSWYPSSKVNVSGTGVGWFLSAAMFSYFMYPYIHRILKNIKNPLVLLGISCLVFIVQIYSAYDLLQQSWGGYTEKYIWFMYCFPIFRLGDMICGCCLGQMFKNLPELKFNYITCSILEILMTLVIAFGYAYYSGPHESILVNAICNWTTPAIALSMIAIFMFASNKGILTRLATNKFFIYIGNVSSHAFFIHFVLIKYVVFFLHRLHISTNGLVYYIIMFILFFVILFVSDYSIKISKKLTFKKQPQK